MYSGAIYKVCALVNAVPKELSDSIKFEVYCNQYKRKSSSLGFATKTKREAIICVPTKYNL